MVIDIKTDRDDQIRACIEGLVNSCLREKNLELIENLPPELKGAVLGKIIGEIVATHQTYGNSPLINQLGSAINDYCLDAFDPTSNINKRKTSGYLLGVLRNSLTRSPDQHSITK